MAGSQNLPGFREKRKVLFGEKTTPEQMLRTGRQFMEAGRFDDALEFFARTDAGEETRQIARVALERGDTPLFLRAKVVLGEEPTEQELSTLARVAEQAGRNSMAYVAHAKAGHAEEANRLQAEVTGVAEPPSEPPGESSPDQEYPKANTPP